MMHKARMEAFSDGVLAVIITIMVLEMRPPAGTSPADLRQVLPVFLGYLLSFLYLGIYWNNHHHLLQAVRRVNGRVLWANLHLLFWLSLIPFVTSWLGRNWSAPWPVALYGIVMVGAAIAYFILTHSLISHHGCDSELAIAVGAETKGLASIALYALAVGLAFPQPRLACAIYITVAVLWIIPDRRIERMMAQRGEQETTGPKG